MFRQESGVFCLVCLQRQEDLAEKTCCAVTYYYHLFYSSVFLLFRIINTRPGLLFSALPITFICSTVGYYCSIWLWNSRLTSAHLPVLSQSLDCSLQSFPVCFKTSYSFLRFKPWTRSEPRNSWLSGSCMLSVFKRPYRPSYIIKMSLLRVF